MSEFSLLHDSVQGRIENAIAWAAEDIAVRMCRPHVLMRPAIYPDGNQWCALYGDNLQEGVCGFGDTAALACIDFDTNWESQRLSALSQPPVDEPALDKIRKSTEC